jgi:hypothetical protein
MAGRTNGDGKALKIHKSGEPDFARLCILKQACLNCRVWGGRHTTGNVNGQSRNVTDE